MICIHYNNKHKLLKDKENVANGNEKSFGLLDKFVIA